MNSTASIDEPTELQDVGPIVRIKGWAIIPDTEVVELCFDGKVLGTVQLFIDRKDVRKAFPTMRTSKPTGFDQVFAVPEASAGLHTLVLRSRSRGIGHGLCARKVMYCDGTDSLLRTVLVDMSRICNFRCDMCPAHSPEGAYKATTLNANDAIIGRILPFLRNPRYAIRRVGAGAIWGEPLMNPRYFENSERIAEACPGAVVSLTTNGSYLTTQNINRILDSGYIRWVCVSVDAGTEETYERIRKGGKWRTLIQNLSKLIAQRADRQSTSPTISTNFVVMKDNFRELPDYVKKMSDLGVDVIGAVNAHSLYASDLDQGVFDFPWKRSEVAEDRDRILQSALSVGLPAGVTLDLPSFLPDRKSAECSFEGASKVLVDTEGEVYPCCVIQSLSYEGKAEARSMGSILEDELESIWNSAEYVDFRLRMLRGEAPCDICHKCPFFYGM